MDFGALGLDGFVGSNNGFASDADTDQKWCGSAGFHKQGRSGSGDDDWRFSKLAKNDDFSASKGSLLQQKSSLLRSTSSFLSDGQEQQQMLSFSSPKSEAFPLERSSQKPTVPYFSLSACNRSSGYSQGSLNCGSMHGGLTAARGPFTPSQWMELEHQALIYKYITANVPVPSNLLIPIRKALDSAGLSIFSGGFLRANTLGWGSFHLGYSNSTDAEPGRCRRTDGKKWRCSRDAVADQKYCERHMNRGRHRSRKPVEGQAGHSVVGTSNANSSSVNTSKLVPSPSSTVTGNGASSNLSISAQHVKNLQTGSSANAAQINRNFMNRDNTCDRIQDAPGFSFLSSGLGMKSKSNTILFQNQQVPSEDSPRAEFGLVSSDFLLNNTSQKSSLLSCKTFDPSHDLNEVESESQGFPRHFTGDWSKNQSDRRAVTWGNISMQSDRTQLSISIPVAPSDFMSSTSSPASEKLDLRLSRELDPVQMGLGVGNAVNEQNSRQANWIPISWETSMGGPLGEVLNQSNNNGDCRSSSALNLMNEGWENSSSLGSSPTGVLQKTAFGSLSSSSGG